MIMAVWELLVFISANAAGSRYCFAFYSIVEV